MTFSIRADTSKYPYRYAKCDTDCTRLIRVFCYKGHIILSLSTEATYGVYGVPIL